MQMLVFQPGFSAYIQGPCGACGRLYAHVHYVRSGWGTTCAQDY